MARQAFRMSDGVMPIVVYAESGEEAHRILAARMDGTEVPTGTASADDRTAAPESQTDVAD